MEEGLTVRRQVVLTASEAVELDTLCASIETTCSQFMRRLIRAELRTAKAKKLKVVK